jgi:hypothetical protein
MKTDTAFGWLESHLFMWLTKKGYDFDAFE